jgi:alpha-1,6-mannosyltransferase
VTRADGALAVAALAMAASLLRGPRAAAGPNLVLIGVAYLALALVVVWARQGRALHRRPVLGLGGALLVLAVVVPPTESGDVWSYAMYGRMVSRYSASPYNHTPAEYQADPIGRRVPRFWLRSRSVYGPLFTALSAAGMAAVGHSTLGARLFFQCLAALAVALALWLLDRRTHDPAALALLAVNPVTVLSVVNGGHNDALVGLALLAGVLLVGARHPAWAGVALAAGALVKVAALLPLAALALWVWHHRGRRPAAAMAGAAAAAGLGGLVVAGAPAVIGALGDASRRISGGSVWAGPHRWLTHAGSSLATGHTLAWAGTLAAVALVALLVVRRPPSEGPVLFAAGSVVAYLLVGTYALPWYLGWGLPVLALAWRWRIVWVAMGQAAVLQLATARPMGDPPSRLTVGSTVSRLQLDLYFVWAPVVEVVLIVVVVTAMVLRLQRASASGEGRSGGAIPAGARPR